MEPTRFSHGANYGAHGSQGFAAGGHIPDQGGLRWGNAEIHGVRFNDFTSPARLLESLLIAAAGIAEGLDSRDRDDAHLSGAALQSHRIALAISRLAEVGHGSDCTDHDPCAACRSLAGKEPCEHCGGEGLVPAGALPNGDIDMDVCDRCTGEGSIPVVLTGGEV